jgi:prolycopene isomerase
MSAGPKDDSYDVAVVGAGLGGLSAGAALARAGKKVLVVERQDGPGGYSHAFRRGPYLFDPAVHLTSQGRPGEFVDLYLRALGVRDLVQFVVLDSLYTADFPGERVHVPAGAERFVEAHAQRWPEERQAIERFVAVCGAVVDESHRVPPRLQLAELEGAAAAFPALFRYRLATAAEVLDEFFEDVRLKAVLASGWPYLGVPPSQASFILYSQMLFSWIDGPVQPLGSFQTFVDAFVAALERNGGELVLGTAVAKIEVDGGRVTGIALEGGRRVRVDAVIANADATQTIERLVGADQFPERFLRRYRRLRPSLSGFVLFTATDLDLAELGLATETFVHDWDHEENYRVSFDGGAVCGTWASLPTLHDPSLAPEGEHLLVFSSLVPYDIGVHWDEAKDRYAEGMLDRLERLVPGYRNHLTFLEAATPLAMERYTLCRDGAIYGWQNTPQQSVGRRLPPIAPIEGLLFAGHWTEPGTGSFRAVYSGFLAALMLLQHERPEELLAALAQG